MTGPQSSEDRADRALRWLRERRRGSVGRPFTSDLSVDELLLVDDAGLEPLQVVMGTSVFHIEPRYTLNVTQEQRHVTAAMYHARVVAVGHLRVEAERLAADGVVGVRIELESERWGEELCEFTAVGTAVRDRSGRLGSRGRPFTCHLSGQELAALLRAGYRPVTLVMGAAAWQVARRPFSTWLAIQGRNQELTPFTKALSAARERAMARMEQEARSAGAAGVVGVSIDQRNRARTGRAWDSPGWGSHTIEFLALGTAVQPLPGAGPPAEPGLAVPVDAPTVRAAEIAVSAGPLGRAGRSLDR